VCVHSYAHAHVSTKMPQARIWLNQDIQLKKPLPYIHLLLLLLLLLVMPPTDVRSSYSCFCSPSSNFKKIHLNLLVFVVITYSFSIFCSLTTKQISESNFLNLWVKGQTSNSISYIKLLYEIENAADGLTIPWL